MYGDDDVTRIPFYDYLAGGLCPLLYIQTQLEQDSFKSRQIVERSRNLFNGPAGYICKGDYRDSVYEYHILSSSGTTLLFDVIIARSIIFQRLLSASSFGNGSEVRLSRVAHCQ